MPPPTLMIKGNLVATEYSEPKSELDKHIPLDYIMDRIKNTMFENVSGGLKLRGGKNIMDRIMLLISKPGSGKSTTIPPELFHRYYTAGGERSIGCTQPTVLTASTIPTDVVGYHSRQALDKLGFTSRTELKMGVNIGYLTGSIKNRIPRGIIYMTYGVLVQQLKTMSDDEFMKKYFVLIIDECHSNSIDLETTKTMLKKFVLRNYTNPECPTFILTSGTFDTIGFADFFFDNIPAPERYSGIIAVSGVSVPLKITWSESDEPDYIRASLKYVELIHKSNPRDFLPLAEIKANPEKYGYKRDTPESEMIAQQKYRDVLVFFEGASPSKKLIKMIDKLNESDPYFQKYPVLAVAIASEDVAAKNKNYKNVFVFENGTIPVYVRGNRKMATRRIIMTTPVAETGLTIKTLKFVVENGYQNVVDYNPDTACIISMTVPITQSNFRQRSARAGREFEGYCYVTYTEATFKSMIEFPFPDIMKTDCSLPILSLMIRETDPKNESGGDKLQSYLKTYNPGDHPPVNIYKLELSNMPPVSMLHRVLENLYTLGAINANNQVTALGFLMNRFNFFTIQEIKMMLAGYAYNVYIPDLITMASFINKADPIESDRFMENAEKFNQSRGANTAFIMKFAGGEYIPEHSKLLTDMILSDDFISYLLIYSELCNVLTPGGDDAEAVGPDSIRKFAETYTISYRQIIDAMDLRENAIYKLAEIGLNPYANPGVTFQELFNNPNYDFYDKLSYIKRIKLCIYEGYKGNLAIYNPIDKKYYSSRTHLEINMISHNLICNNFKTVVDTNPRYFIYDKITYKGQPTKTASGMFDKIFAIHPGNVSVMDGYVNVDPQL